MGFQAALKREPHEDDNVFESPVHAADKVASPKMTPSKKLDGDRHTPSQQQECHDSHEVHEMPHHTTAPQRQASEIAQKHDTCDQEQQLKEDAEDEEEQSQSQPKQEQKPESEEESREAEEPAAQERTRPLIKRKNSYRAAQEKNPIADEFWYVDKDPNRERTRSSGNLFDDERYYERQMARSVNN